jgi:hypothetical protein
VKYFQTSIIRQQHLPKFNSKTFTYNNFRTEQKLQKRKFCSIALDIHEQIF